MKVILPIVVLGTCILAAYILVALKPAPETKPPEPVISAVKVVMAQPSDIPLQVSSQGTVQARTETSLTAEVAGRVLSISPNFRPGGFVEKGEVLVTIDPADYEANLAEALASLEQAELSLAQEKALADQAKIDWEELGRGEPTELALNLPQVDFAEAGILSAQAAVDRARRDLERTQIRAPYPGRVLEQMIDVGGYVTGSPGSVVGRIYGTDVAEVRLPVTDEEMAYLDLPFAFRNGDESTGPHVVLHADFGGETHEWAGSIIRSEASVDPRSRLLFVVASVDDPYVRHPEFPSRPPLKVGMFVQASIEGKQIEDAYQIPRIALIDNETLLIANGDDKLERRQVKVASSDEQHAVITGGLEPGDRIIVTPLQYVVNGMPLKVADRE